MFRFVAILFATLILQLWWLQAVGAIYLVFITVKHFLSHKPEGHDMAPAKQMGFWQTVIAVEVADIAFAVDSVLAAVAVVKGAEKLWVVYVGALMGVILLRFAAGVFIRLLDRFPSFDHVAYALVGWVGVKLCFLAGHNFEKGYTKSGATSPLPFYIPELSPLIFWSVMGLMIVVGTLIALSRPAPKEEVDLDETAEAAEEMADLDDERKAD